MKLIGVVRLGGDAELKYTSSGDPVANISGAFEFGRKGEDGKLQTQWVSLGIFGKRAEKLAEYLKKGRQVFVSCGDVHVRTFEHKGVARASLSARVEDLQLIGPREDEKAPTKERAETTPAIDAMDDDIPF